MSFALSEENRRDVISRAGRDEGFATRLLSDPRATIADSVGASVPESVSINVVRDSATKVHTVIPHAPIDLETAEAQLKAQLTKAEAEGQTRVLRIIIDKAQKDETFRAELKSSTRDVFARELGAALPGDVEIRVLEEGATETHLVLPPPRSEAVELSDEELGTVAGGRLTGGEITLFSRVLTHTLTIDPVSTDRRRREL